MVLFWGIWGIAHRYSYPILHIATRRTNDLVSRPPYRAVPLSRPKSPGNPAYRHLVHQPPREGLRFPPVGIPHWVGINLTVSRVWNSNFIKSFYRHSLNVQRLQLYPFSTITPLSFIWCGFSLENILSVSLSYRSYFNLFQGLGSMFY